MATKKAIWVNSDFGSACHWSMTNKQVPIRS
jgi:hypothetical protein